MGCYAASQNHPGTTLASFTVIQTAPYVWPPFSLLSFGSELLELSLVNGVVQRTVCRCVCRGIMYCRQGPTSPTGPSGPSGPSGSTQPCNMYVCSLTAVVSWSLTPNSLLHFRTAYITLYYIICVHHPPSTHRLPTFRRPGLHC